MRSGEIITLHKKIKLSSQQQDKDALRYKDKDYTIFNRNNNIHGILSDKKYYFKNLSNYFKIF